MLELIDWILDHNCLLSWVCSDLIIDTVFGKIYISICESLKRRSYVESNFKKNKYLNLSSIL